MEPLRLDRLLVERGLAASRPRAEWLIAEHGVKVNGTIVHKPGKKVPADAVLEPLGEELPWVSRGAPNLIAALDQFDLDPSGRNILDLGASTGGFTEVCLHRNAAHVHAVDVGSGQLSNNLKSDPRVKNLEQLNLKDLRREHLDPTPNTVVIDLSFISLSHVWPRLTQWVSPQGWGGRIGQAPIRGRSKTPWAQRHRSRRQNPEQSTSTLHCRGRGRRVHMHSAH